MTQPENSPWLFKKPQPSQTDACILLTPVSGSIFLQPSDRGSQSKKGYQQDKVIKEMLEGKKAAKAKPKARGKGRGKGASGQQANGEASATMDEPDVTTDHVQVAGPDGDTLSRCKYFIDCLIGGVRSALKAARAKYGVAAGASLMGAGGGDGALESDMHVYEYDIARSMLRAGIVFALTGNAMLNKKVFRRWSAMRPALQADILRLVAEAGKIDL